MRLYCVKNVTKENLTYNKELFVEQQMKRT